MKVNIVKKSDNAKLPTRGSEGAAGYDVYAATEKIMPSPTGLIVEYDTGLAFELPKGYYMDVRPRSGVTTKTSLILGNGCGVLDSDYRGTLKFQFRDTNPGNGRKYQIGDRIGQILIKKYEDVDFTEVETLTDTERGEGGFGSTDEQDKEQES